MGDALLCVKCQKNLSGTHWARIIKSHTPEHRLCPECSGLAAQIAVSCSGQAWQVDYLQQASSDR